MRLLLLPALFALSMLANLQLAAGDLFHGKPAGRDLQVKAVTDALATALAK